MYVQLFEGIAVAREFPMKKLGRAAFAVALALTSVAPALAGEAVHRHAMSLVRPPKYPADFKYFDYVNPDAPKGGEIRETHPRFSSFELGQSHSLER